MKIVKATFAVIAIAFTSASVSASVTNDTESAPIKTNTIVVKKQRANALYIDVTQRTKTSQQKAPKRDAKRPTLLLQASF